MKNYIKVIFAVFGVLAAFDIVLLVYSNEYRNIFGEVRNTSEVMWRFIADIVMVIFYGFVYWKTKKGISLPRLMVWHGVLYSLLGVAMCIPWAGYFLAPFSAVGLLYLTSIIWIQDGYYLSLAITVMFIAFNLHLIQRGLKERKYNLSKLRPS